MKEIVTKCFNYLLSTPNGMLAIIKISHNKPRDYFLEAFLLYIKPFIELLYPLDDLKDFHKVDVENSSDPKAPKAILQNLTHLLNYFAVWVTAHHKIIIQHRENEICDVIDKLFSIFEKLRFVYATFPDLRITLPQFDIGETIKVMESQPDLMRNGGIYFTMLSLLMDVFSEIKGIQNRASLLKMISLLMCSRSLVNTLDKSGDKLWQSYDLMQKIEISNKQLLAQLDLPVYNTYFGPIQNKAAQIQPMVIFSFPSNNLIRSM